MRDETNIGHQKLGALIDETVSSKTLNWIQSLATETMVREAAIAFPKNDSSLKNFNNRLLTGEIDVAIFITAAGFSHFFERSARITDKKRLVNSLADIKTIASSELVANKMLELGIKPGIQILDETDWRELLIRLDRECPVTNLSVALETTADVHGISAGLEARGASVSRLETIEFKHVDPSSDEQDILDAIEDGDLGTMLFPNPICAARFAILIGGRERPILKKNSQELIVLALGEETQQMLTDRGIDCDVVLSDQQVKSEIQHSLRSVRIIKESSNQQLSGPGSNASDKNAPWYNSNFMKAIRRETVSTTPVWMMRQAGRYMKEYRDVREKVPFLELCKNSQLCSEVMCTAVARLGVDAAIIFSDLLPILEPIGCDLEYSAGEGPVIHSPVRTNQDIERIKELETNDELDFVMETVRLTRTDLPADLPLIGFAGAPFTLASYMIEGGATKNFIHTKTLMYGDEGAWNELMSKLVRATKTYLIGQIEAGAQCVQLFDSWAGCLGVAEYRQYVLPYVVEIIDAVSPLAPVINFATGNPALLAELTNTTAQVIGIDWRIPLDSAWQIVGHRKAVQGNLDPTVLLTNPKVIRQKVKEILDLADNRNGHIFNLGHGVLPQTPVDNAIALVDIVHELSQR